MEECGGPRALHGQDNVEQMGGEDVGQQVLQNTQLDGAGDFMDVTDNSVAEGEAVDTGDLVAGVGGTGAGSSMGGAGGTGDGAAATSGSSTDRRATERGSNASFGDGRVQSNLDDWLL